jgi:hypothetical protein
LRIESGTPEILLFCFNEIDFFPYFLFHSFVYLEILKVFCLLFLLFFFITRIFYINRWGWIFMFRRY